MGRTASARVTGDERTHERASERGSEAARQRGSEGVSEGGTVQEGASEGASEAASAAASAAARVSRADERWRCATRVRVCGMAVRLWMRGELIAGQRIWLEASTRSDDGWLKNDELYS